MFVPFVALVPVAALVPAVAIVPFVSFCEDLATSFVELGKVGSGGIFSFDRGLPRRIRLASCQVSNAANARQMILTGRSKRSNMGLLLRFPGVKIQNHDGHAYLDAIGHLWVGGELNAVNNNRKIDVVQVMQ